MPNLTVNRSFLLLFSKKKRLLKCNKNEVRSSPMRSVSLFESAVAAAIVVGTMFVAVPSAHANGWYGGGWGPRFVVRVGPPCYRYYGPRPYYFPRYYAPGAYYRPYYWGPSPYYVRPRGYYGGPVIGFGVTVR
jgi:hypothetical protein